MNKDDLMANIEAILVNSLPPDETHSELVAAGVTLNEVAQAVGWSAWGRNRKIDAETAVRQVHEALDTYALGPADS